MPNNLKDRHVLAAAIVAGAGIIVTSNLRDFPSEQLAAFGIEAQSPDEFLINLFALEPDVIVEIIHHQAAALKQPPMTADEILEKLAVHAPNFAMQVRFYRKFRNEP